MADEHTVTGGERQILVAAELHRSVARVHDALPPSHAGSHVVFAFDRDRTAFVAALLASWTKGHAVALPANPRRAAVVPVLGQPGVTVLAHDSGIGMGLDVPKLLASPPSAEAQLLKNVRNIGALTSYGLDANGGLASRSWSTAALQALVLDTVARLELPARAIVWNAFRPGCPHALVPGVLAPLHAGYAIAGGTAADATTLPRKLEALAVHTLVGPASLLRALARWPRHEFATLRQVVAADAPLDGKTRARLHAASLRVLELPALTAAMAPDARAMALQDAVLGIDGVTDAAVELVETADGPSFFCAVIAPCTTDDLRRQLPAALATATLRVVPTLPRDADGQLARDVLLRLFGRDGNGALPSRQLQLAAASRADDRMHWSTHVPVDFFAFDGHFPGYPVLSGAVQLHELVLPCLRAADERLEVVAFQDLKFLARIAPGDTVDVALRIAENGEFADFEITRDGARCSAGRAVLRHRTREQAP